MNAPGSLEVLVIHRECIGRRHTVKDRLEAAIIIGNRLPTKRSSTWMMFSLLLLMLSCNPSHSFIPKLLEHGCRRAQQQRIGTRGRYRSCPNLYSSSKKSEPSHQFRSTLLDEPTSWKSQWGVERHSSHSFPFPTTLSALTDQIVTIGLAAVDGSSYEEANPNVVQNALLGDRVLGRRPVRHDARDAGRIGIEIDGPVNILYVGLIAAAKVSQTQQIPVTVYFDSWEETVQARAMLLRLCERSNGGNLYKNIQIQVLADARLPNHQRRKGNTVGSTAKLDVSKGVLLVIQPTRNYMTHLQRLAAQATMEGLPLILLSPRMTREITSPWDQSGYQHAAAYGGDEPPTGPTPWLMRDFWPPVYSWILTAEFGYSHSILHKKQSWDVFDCRKIDGTHTECDYLASSVNCAGRPTQSVLRKIAKEFGQEARM